MFKADIQEACEVKEPFEFSYVKSYGDWGTTKNVRIPYNLYNSLTLERRYGPCWWLVGYRYDKDKWKGLDIGLISNYDIKRLVEWARFTTKNGRTINILTEVRAIDGSLNPIDEFLKIMQKENDNISSSDTNTSVKKLDEALPWLEP